jgi:hypothetical protein
MEKKSGPLNAPLGKDLCALVCALMEYILKKIPILGSVQIGIQLILGDSPTRIRYSACHAEVCLAIGLPW